MRHLYILTLAIVAQACVSVPESADQKIIDRMVYIFDLKPMIATEIWTGFDGSDHDVPLVYFTDSSSYIANPTDQFLNTYAPTLVYQNAHLKIYRTVGRLDDVPFHMATGFTMGDTAVYDNLSPFMRCSGYEETHQAIEDVGSTEEWVTMVIHEYFHGFQFKHSNYLQWVADSIAVMPQDSLAKLYANDPWFKEQLDAENQLLLLALKAEGRSTMDSLITAFFTTRQQRRQETKQRLGVAIEAYEKTYETMEGTARYVEHGLYERFALKQPDAQLLRSDTAYRSYAYFKTFSLAQATWLYSTENSGMYFYATGFNMARLLDKLNVRYKHRLFIEQQLSLEDLLWNSLAYEAGQGPR